MKPCGYCGKENEETAMHCVGCGIPLTTKTSGSLAEAMRWSPSSSFSLSVTGGLGALLISTAVYFLIGRVTLDVSRFFKGEDADSSFYTPVIMFLPFMSALLGIAALGFIWFVSYRRCKTRLQALLSATVTSVAMVVLLFGPRFVPELFSLLWLLPVTLIGFGTGVSAGYYFGAALQLAAGGWLLGWFSHTKSESETNAS